MKYLEIKKVLQSCYIKSEYTLQRVGNDKYILNWLDNKIQRPNDQELESKLQELLLKEVKARKIEGLNKFYDFTARTIIIRNGAIQPIIINQDFVNNVNSAIRQAEANIDNIYYHRLVTANGKDIVLDKNNQPIIIKMSISALQYVLQRIEVKRGYCYCNKQFHKTIINKLTNIQEVEDYNYQIDELNNNITIAEEILLDMNGDVVTGGREQQID